jgi:protein-disulfide isomerase
MRAAFLSDLATGVLVVCALTVTAAVVRRELATSRTPGAPDLRPRRARDWPAMSAHGHWLGDPRAPVRIVEFSDFQCPFCARTHPVLETVLQRHPGRVAVLYRHYPPVAFQPPARPAARAAECAAEEGRFAFFARLVFAHQDSLPTLSWPRLALAAGVRDTLRFKRCLAGPASAARVERDVRLARASGLEVTPTLVVNGMIYPGAMGVARLEALVRAAASP